MTASGTLAFVLCVEGGRFGREAIGLVRSLRRFGGALKDCAVLTIAPRPPNVPSPAALETLASLGVDHRSLPLNTRYPAHPLANKVFVAAYAERELATDFVVLMDTDTAILGSPEALLLDAGHDAAAVPVYQKSISSTGSDEHAPLWAELHRICGSSRDVVVRTHCEDLPILGHWNSGLVCTRRAAGIFHRWEANFIRTMEIRDRLPVEPRLHQRLEQATLGATLAALPQSVVELPRTYNYPIAMHHKVAPKYRPAAMDDLVTVHYAGRPQHLPSSLPLLVAAARASPRMRYFLTEVLRAGGPAGPTARSS